MGGKLSKRKKYFIDKSFQTKFILKFCLITIIFSAAAGCVLFFLSRNSTTVAIANTKVTVKTTADFILPIVIETLLLTAVFSAAAVIVLTLFVSHRISGPLYRLRREIDALKDGDLLRDFNIRGGDQLKELSASLNDMRASLWQKISALSNTSSNLRDSLRKNDFCVSGNDKKYADELLKETETILKYFKV